MLQREMRRKDRQIPNDQALAILDNGSYLTLSMVDEAAAPYAVPLSFGRIEGTLYFHCALQGMKVDILRHNPRVCCVVVNAGTPYFNNGDFTTSFESAIVFGTAREIHDPDERLAGISCICNKYLPEHQGDIASAMERSGSRTSIWAIDIESITGKAHE